MAKKLLIRCGAAARIKERILHRQIRRILEHPERMIQGARRALRFFFRRIIPEACHRDRKLLIQTMGRLDPIREGDRIRQKH